MEKTFFEKLFNDCLDKNYMKYSKYFEYKFKIFFELQTSIFEAAKCLILELDKATITLTNYMLERLLKLALIHKEVGMGSIPIEKWNTVFEGPSQKYGSVNLGNSIEHCLNRNLITQAERDFLFNTVRELMRNGFSHADTEKILKDIPEIAVGFYANFNNPQEIKRVDLNQKTISPLQAVQIDNFAKENSFYYFEYVFGLIEKLENRLIDQNKPV